MGLVFSVSLCLCGEAYIRLAGIDAYVEFFANPRSSVTIASGQTSRQK